MKLPSGLKAALLTLPVLPCIVIVPACPFKSATSLQVRASHTCTISPARTETTSFPSGLTSSAPLGSSHSFCHEPVSKTCFGRPCPVNSNPPSGLNLASSPAASATLCHVPACHTCVFSQSG